MPLTADLKSQVDTLFDDIDKQMTSLQDDYFAANRKYCQLPGTHDTLPADGNAVASNGNKKIAGYPSWNDFGINLPATCKACVMVDVYDGPQGHGYVLNGDVEQAFSHYKRCKNVGPETRRTYDWKEIIESVLT